jgi:hypothetical protein
MMAALHLVSSKLLQISCAEVALQHQKMYAKFAVMVFEWFLRAVMMEIGLM